MSRIASAQTYPARPARIVVGLPRWYCGPTLLRALLVRDCRSGSVSHSSLRIDSGAGTNIGTEAVVRAPADGYTLLLVTVGKSAINASLYDKLNFNFIRDIAPVAKHLPRPVCYGGQSHRFPPRPSPSSSPMPKRTPVRSTWPRLVTAPLEPRLRRTVQNDGRRRPGLTYLIAAVICLDLLGGQVQVIFTRNRYSDRVRQRRQRCAR